MLPLTNPVVISEPPAPLPYLHSVRTTAKRLAMQGKKIVLEPEGAADKAAVDKTKHLSIPKEWSNFPHLLNKLCGSYWLSHHFRKGHFGPQ